MTSYLSVQQHIIFKVGSAYAIAIGLVVSFLIVVPPAFADEENEINNPKLHNSVAVLPFDNLSPNPDDAYFAVGIHQQILDHLTKIRDINPIYRPSVLRYEDTDKAIAEIAAELNVETIMKGSVRYVDNQFNIDVQLIDASNNIQLWSKAYKRNLSDVFEIQAEIVGHIALALAANITAAEQKRVKRVPTQSLQAYTLYLKAMILIKKINQMMSPEFYQYLDQAIALDSEFALAHAIKARSYALTKRVSRQIGELTPDEIESVALEHIKIAMALDPNLVMAHMAQAEIHRSHQRVTETKQAYEQSLQLGPNIVELLINFSHFSLYLGEADKATLLAEHAQALTPNDATSHYLLGGQLMYAGKSALAAEQFRRAIALEPNFFYYLNLFFAEILSGNDVEALQSADQLMNEIANTTTMARVAYAYSRLGHQKDAIRVYKLLETTVATGKTIKPHAKALSYLAIGEIDKAYDLLFKNPTDGLNPLKEIKDNLLNNPVLEEPRFVELRDRIGTSN